MAPALGPGGDGHQPLDMILAAGALAWAVFLSWIAGRKDK